MTDKLRRLDDTGEVWDGDLFVALAHRIPPLSQAYESVSAGAEAGNLSMSQLQEEFRVH